MLMQELTEKLNMPSDTKMMTSAIDDLNNLSLPLEDRQRALQELLVLVEPIGNANGMCNFQPSSNELLWVISPLPVLSILAYIISQRLGQVGKIL